MKVELIAATVESKPVIINLARFYAYELSKYCGDNAPGSEFPEDGLYVAHEVYFNFDSYWKKPGYFPFIVRVNNELAGFVLVDKKGSTPDVDWYMAEFFIVAKFQGMGVGRNIATQIFDKFPGVWEVMQMPENIPAIKFWEVVVGDYTKQHYDVCLKMIPDPEPHDMMVLKFQSSAK